MHLSFYLPPIGEECLDEEPEPRSNWQERLLLKPVQFQEQLVQEVN
jgi:hypothetical protein